MKPGIPRPPARRGAVPVGPGVGPPAPSAGWRTTLATEHTTHEPRSLNPPRGLRDARYTLTTTLLRDPAFRWPDGIDPAECRKVQRKAAMGEFLELYDLQADPREFTNLAGRAELRDAQERLAGELRRWREATQNPLLDPAVLQALVVKEKDAAPTPVPAWKQKAKAPRTPTAGSTP